jgi:hypothetical protein
MGMTDATGVGDLAGTVESRQTDAAGLSVKLFGTDRRYHGKTQPPTC